MLRCSKDGIMDFFNEQQLDYEEIQMSNGKDYYYATKNRRLVIFNTNFYTLDEWVIEDEFAIDYKSIMID